MIILWKKFLFVSVIFYLATTLACVLGADMIDLVKNDILKNNSVVRVNQVDVCNAGVNGDRYLPLMEHKLWHVNVFCFRVILIIRDVTVVLSDCEKIGDPVQLGKCHIRSAIWIWNETKKFELLSRIDFVCLFPDNHDSTQRTAISLSKLFKNIWQKIFYDIFEDIPRKQSFSTVSKSGLAKKNSNDEWQADDGNSKEVVLEKPKINANKMCNINVLDPFRTE